MKQCIYDGQLVGIEQASSYANPRYPKQRVRTMRIHFPDGTTQEIRESAMGKWLEIVELGKIGDTYCGVEKHIVAAEQISKNKVRVTIKTIYFDTRGTMPYPVKDTHEEVEDWDGCAVLPYQVPSKRAPKLIAA